MQGKEEDMSASHPVESSKTTNTQSELQQGPKTATRFPPLVKIKSDQNTNNRENKNQQGYPSLKKNTNKKKDQKISTKIIQIRPQIREKYRSYKEFLMLVAISHNLHVISAERPHYVLFVGKGNNSSLIKTLFRNYRPWWIIEENSPDNPAINLYWYQLRQNDLLQSFKDNQKNVIDLQNCDFYLQDKPKEEGVVQRESSISLNRVQTRSQSMTHKGWNQPASKRSASRTKGASNQKGIFQKQLGQQLRQIQSIGKKKVLANPKMWPIYQSYRRLFNQKELKQLKSLQALDQDWHLKGTLNRLKIRVIEGKTGYPKFHNHLLNNWNLSNKKALFMNLKHYYEVQKINPFDYIPMTFHVTQLGDKEFVRFKEEYERRGEQFREEDKSRRLLKGIKSKKRNAWLVKPGENTNRGTGIEVVQTLEQVEAIIRGERIDKQGRPRTHIIQQYISPFLYQKRKFDIRAYVLVTGMNGQQKGYWFQDGYIRTACRQFNMKNLSNKYIHLTNDAVQKHHQDYGRFQPGNKLSFPDFQRYLQTTINAHLEPTNKLRFYQTAYPQMKKLASDSVRSVYGKIDSSKKQFSFEIFGLDFLIDQNFKVWLIEVNTNPCLQLSCPLLGRLIPNMLENAFKIAIDPYFPPPPLSDLLAFNRKIVLPDSLLENNKFQLIFDEAEEGTQLRSIFTNAPQLKIYDIEEEDQQYEENENNRNLLTEQQRIQ